MSKEEEYQIKIDFDVLTELPENNRVQLFYKNEGEHYSEDKSEVVFIKPGNNVAYLSLDGSLSDGYLRLDIGDSKGKFKINEIRIDKITY